ncbi:hypothetical protein Patl1_12700 [Pistacia atlantica]|uniref:Uncharacterized protein n=1 Tax=Pistacia atlantica TaxID=434234 RepID=A0ACC1ATT5_9ROSI|nr:hypothetical protein Patl1_12700 [Pistacia atlantica]
MTSISNPSSSDIPDLNEILNPPAPDTQVNTAKARKVIVQDLQAVVAAANYTPHNMVPVWEVTAPTVENFLQEMAKEEPVRFRAQQLFCFTSWVLEVLGQSTRVSFQM